MFANLKHKCSMWCIYKRSRSPRHISRSSGLFLDYPDTFYMIRKLSSSSTHLLDHPDTFQFIRTFYYLDTLYITLTFSKSSGNSSVNNKLVAKTFRILSGYFVKHPDIFQVIQKLFTQMNLCRVVF